MQEAVPWEGEAPAVPTHLLRKMGLGRSLALPVGDPVLPVSCLLSSGGKRAVASAVGPPAAAHHGTDGAVPSTLLSPDYFPSSSRRKRASENLPPAPWRTMTRSSEGMT